MARAHIANDYGTPSNRFYRPVTLANHALHFVSSIIVLGISAYFIDKFSHNTHLIYWITIASIDSFLHPPALFLHFVKSYRDHLAPISWVFSYLWLTAFIFASQDYDFDNCVANSPSFVDKCGLKKTLEAFAFLAFFTNLVGQVLEGRLWGTQRFQGGPTVEADKPTVPTSTEPGAATAV